jgi:hypothetical protein
MTGLTGLFQAHQHCRGRNNRLAGRRWLSLAGRHGRVSPRRPPHPHRCAQATNAGPQHPPESFPSKSQGAAKACRHAKPPPADESSFRLSASAMVCGCEHHGDVLYRGLSMAKCFRSPYSDVCPQAGGNEHIFALSAGRGGALLTNNPEFATPTLDVSVQTYASRPSRAMKISRTAHVATRGGILRGQGLEMLLEHCLCNLCFMDAPARHACLAFSTPFVLFAGFFFSSFLGSSIRSLTW